MTTTCIIVSYKYGHLAAQAVDSVLSQTTPFDEVVFIDDGVGDCRHIPDLYPEVNFIERANNLGTVDNFQRALMDVDTDYVMFLGADNWLHMGALMRLLEEDADIISYDIYLTGTEWEPFGNLVAAELAPYAYPVWRFKEGNINQGNYIHGSSLYNVEKAKKVGYKASGNRHTEEDWMLFKGMLEHGATHKHVPMPFLYYRRHRENFNL